MPTPARTQVDQVARRASSGDLTLGRRLLPGTGGGIGVLIAVSSVLRASATALVLCMVGLLGLSLGTVYQKRFAANMDIRSGTAVQFLVSTPVVFGVCTLISPLRVSAWLPFGLAVAWMIVINSAGAFVLLYAMLRRSSASRVGMVFFLTPSVTALLSWLLVGQSLRAAEILGLAVAGLGVLLACTQGLPPGGGLLWPGRHRRDTAGYVLQCWSPPPSPWPTRVPAACTARGGHVAGARAGGAAARLPHIEPMLATPARELPPDPGEWAAEIKWDGARAVAYAADGEVVLRNRNGGDVTSGYPEVAAALAAAAGRRTLILDGELVAFDGGKPSFALLQRRLHVSRPQPRLLSAVPVTYVAFDLLRQASRPLLRNPYRQRRALLDDLGLERDWMSVPPAFPGQAEAVSDASRALGLEGVILKRLSSLYYPGRRSDAWLKVKHIVTADIVIGGWLPGAGWRAQLAGSIIAGQPGPNGLAYLGQVGSGFSEAELTQLTARLRGLEQPDSPFARPLPAPVERHAHWVRPVLAAEVAYSELTPSGRLRHPVWRGLRPA